MNLKICSRVIAAAIILAAAAGLAVCTSVLAGQHPGTSMVASGTMRGEVRYLLYVPETYGKDRNVKWPLILYLHGYGERGNNLELLKKHPLPQTLETQKSFPFIVVSPQLEDWYYEWDSRLELLDALLLQIQTRYSVDPKRIYVTGLSIGGAGTWKMALRFPRRFAAIVPVAGFYTFESRDLPPGIADLRDLPIWAFHGARDSNVLLYQDEIIVNALKACGSNVKFTVYDDAGHEETWRRAYADPALYEWMLSQSLR